MMQRYAHFSPGHQRQGHRAARNPSGFSNPEGAAEAD